MSINTKRYVVSWTFSHRYGGYKKNTDNYVHLSNAAGIRLQEHIVQSTVTTICHVSCVATDEQQILNIMLQERVGLLYVKIITRV